MSETTQPRLAAKRVDRKPTREDKVMERRLSLLESALRVIARKGLVGVTMGDIAAEAGCAYGVVSFHFKSKDGITLAVLDHMVEEYDRALQRACQDTPEARLKAAIELDFDPNISDAGRIAVFTAFWAESARNPEYRKRCADLKVRYHAAVTADIAELVERGKIDINASLVARSLNAMIDGMWIRGQVYNDIDGDGREIGKAACLLYLRSFFPTYF
jgi:TetR/AcrR family transcriptional repressor of bet genes